MSSTAATIGLAFSVLFFLTRLVFLVQRRLLWRVRRKLILSYIFIGVVPSLLILGFFLLGTSFMSQTVASYLFRNGFDDVSRNVQLLAEAAAAEIGRSPRTADETVDRVQRNGSASLRYPTLSMAFVPASSQAAEACRGARGSICVAQSEPGPTVPDWVRDRAGWLDGNDRGGAARTRRTSPSSWSGRSGRPGERRPRLGGSSSTFRSMTPC